MLPVFKNVLLLAADSLSEVCTPAESSIRPILPTAVVLLQSLQQDSQQHPHVPGHALPPLYKTTKACCSTYTIQLRMRMRNTWLFRLSLCL